MQSKLLMKKRKPVANKNEYSISSNTFCFSKKAQYKKTNTRESISNRIRKDVPQKLAHSLFFPKSSFMGKNFRKREEMLRVRHEKDEFWYYTFKHKADFEFKSVMEIW
uniref:Uncharacterized protein n=1 Tax=Romanomermis culicivorax TaxID=13658 RepID=A0A915J2M1_ROMCU